jgi:hypothetical protein
VSTADGTPVDDAAVLEVAPSREALAGALASGQVTLLPRNVSYFKCATPPLRTTPDPLWGQPGATFLTIAAVTVAVPSAVADQLSLTVGSVLAAEHAAVQYLERVRSVDVVQGGRMNGTRVAATTLTMCGAGGETPEPPTVWRHPALEPEAVECVGGNLSQGLIALGAGDSVGDRVQAGSTALGRGSKGGVLGRVVDLVYSASTLWVLLTLSLQRDMVSPWVLNADPFRTAQGPPAPAPHWLEAQVVRGSQARVRVLATGHASLSAAFRSWGSRGFQASASLTTSMSTVAIVNVSSAGGPAQPPQPALVVDVTPSTSWRWVAYIGPVPVLLQATLTLISDVNATGLPVTSTGLGATTVVPLLTNAASEVAAVVGAGSGPSSATGAGRVIASSSLPPPPGVATAAASLLLHTRLVLDVSFGVVPVVTRLALHQSLGVQRMSVPPGDPGSNTLIAVAGASPSQFSMEAALPLPAWRQVVVPLGIDLGGPVGPLRPSDPPVMLSSPVAANRSHLATTLSLQPGFDNATAYVSPLPVITPLF